jgi:hypothetical protein
MAEQRLDTGALSEMLPENWSADEVNPYLG